MKFEQMKKLGASLACTLVLSLGVSSMANAAPIVFCSNGGVDLVADGCISGDSKAYPGGGDGIYSNAGGGDPESAVEAAILSATGTAVDLSLYGKSDSDAGLFSFSGALTSTTSGTWDVLDDAIAIAYITIKAANSFALFDVQGANSGVYNTAGILNNGGQQPDVSHISFWTTDGGGPTVGVPEPSSLALFGLGLAALGMRRKLR